MKTKLKRDNIILTILIITVFLTMIFFGALSAYEENIMIEQYLNSIEP